MNPEQPLNPNQNSGQSLPPIVPPTPEITDPLEVARAAGFIPPMQRAAAAAPRDTVPQPSIAASIPPVPPVPPAATAPQQILSTTPPVQQIPTAFGAGLGSAVMPPPKKKSPLMMIVVLLALLILLALGGLYVYGAYVHSKNEANQPQAIPENGFQVTESQVDEPNFDDLDTMYFDDTSGRAEGSFQFAE